MIPAPETFRVLRDGESSDNPNVEARRAGVDAVLSDLEGHGVGRGDLQLAWDFTTGSL